LISETLQPHIEKFLKSFYVEENSEIDAFVRLNKIPAVDVITGNFIKFLLVLDKT